MNIVLVHGFWDQGRIFKRMIKQLSAEGYDCYAPDLKPTDARLGITDLATKLETYIDQTLDQNTTFAMVGFSMGAIIARYYLQLMDGHKRVTGLVSLAGPHNGSIYAHCYIGQGARDLRPNSELMKTLRNTEGRLSHIPLTAYWSPFDVVVVPSKSAQWAAAVNKKVNVLWHDGIPRDKRVIKFVTADLKAITPNAA